MEGYGMQGYDWKCKDYVRIPITVDKDTPGIGMRSFTNLPFMV